MGRRPPRPDSPLGAVSSTHLLRGLGVPPSDALFVDDREQNIKAAQALGIRSIQFRSMAQFRNDLEKLGFPILPMDAKPASPAPQVGAVL